MPGAFVSGTEPGMPERYNLIASIHSAHCSDALARMVSRTPRAARGEPSRQMAGSAVARSDAVSALLAQADDGRLRQDLVQHILGPRARINAPPLLRRQCLCVDAMLSVCLKAIEERAHCLHNSRVTGGVAWAAPYSIPDLHGPRARPPQRVWEDVA